MDQNKGFSFNVFNNRVKLYGTLSLVSGLHIGTGRVFSTSMSDSPVLKDFLGSPFIPGSSLKGVLRSNLESSLRSLKPDSSVWLACDPTSKPDDSDSRCISSDAKKKITNANDIDKDKAFFDQSCLICRLFGSMWIASKVHIVDMKVKGDWRNEWLMVRDGVVIDRESETATTGGKYDLEAVPAGTHFTFEMIVENPEPYEMGLIMLGIDLINQGFAMLGGSISRGLGRIKIDIDDIVVLTIDNLLEQIRPKGEPIEDTPPPQESTETTINDTQPQDIDIFDVLTECLKGTKLSHEELVNALKAKGIDEKMLKDKGFGKDKKPWKPFFEKAVKEEKIALSNDKYYLPGEVPVLTVKVEQENTEESSKNQEHEKKIECWKNELWRKLQQDELDKIKSARVESIKKAKVSSEERRA
jgi:CRISPR-associated RAMP protein (TIGR02581 family)